jgi:hypothetical protein
VSRFAGDLIAEQFVRSLESVFPSATLCLEHDVVPKNLHDREEWEADRDEYEFELACIINSYIGENTELTRQMQPEVLGKLLLSASLYIARYMAFERPTRNASAQRQIVYAKNERCVRFSHFQSVIGKGGGSCTEPVKLISTTRSTMSPILDDYPAFLPEAIPTNSLLYMTMDNAHDTHTQRDPARDLEDKLHASFTRLAALEQFKDLVHECHALWYIYFSRRKMRYNISETMRKTTGQKQPVYGGILITTDWNPAPLLEHLQDMGEQSSIKRILTITGNPQIAYAATCEEYVAQAWPTIGPGFLDRMDDAVHKRRSTAGSGLTSGKSTRPPPTHMRWVRRP